jgi:hypothetical protein
MGRVLGTMGGLWWGEMGKNGLILGCHGRSVVG